MTDQALYQLLDRPVAYHPVLADLVGSVEAAIMLSQALYWQRRGRAEDGYWYTSREDWYDQTRLGRYAQERAREVLRRHAWWSEQRRGVPARLYYRVDIGELYRAIIQMADRLPSSRQTVAQQDGRPSASQMADGLPANTETTRDYIETTTTDGRGGGHTLHWPRLQPDDRTAAELLLASCPGDRRQQVLDVLAAAISDRTISRSSPIPYLSALVAAAAGERGARHWDPSPGYPVARARDRARQARAAIVAPSSSSPAVAESAIEAMRSSVRRRR